MTGILALSSSQQEVPHMRRTRSHLLSGHRRSRSDTRISYSSTTTKKLPKDLLNDLTTPHREHSEDNGTYEHDIQNISIDIFTSAYAPTPYIPIPPPLPSSSKLKKQPASTSPPTTSPPPPPPAIETCPVCFEEVPSPGMYSFPCSHKYCRECVTEHLRISIDNGKARKLKCLNPSCNMPFPVHLLSTFVDAKTFDKYNLFINTPADCTWCPAPGCDTPMVKSEGAGCMGVCKCGTKFCFDCRTPWHEGYTCAEFKEKGGLEKTKDEIASLELAMASGMQPCPKCGIWSEKMDGCEYVKCVTCNHEFCWDCLEPHDHNMGAHVHGPKYKGPRNTPYQAVARRKRRIRNILAYTGIAVGTVVLGPPLLALGTVAAVVTLPVVAIKALVVLIRRRRLLKVESSNMKRKLRVWAVEEKKRREDLGLPVSEMVLDLAK